MGCFKLFSSGSSCITDPRNPIPTYFRIKKSVRVKEVWVSLINYPNCTNFEGDKILVTLWDPTTKKAIDPHFTENNGIVARMIPNDVGWEMAMIFAESIQE